MSLGALGLSKVTYHSLSLRGDVVVDRFHEIAKVLEDHGIAVRPEDIAFTQRLRNGITVVYVAKGGVIARFYVLSDGRVLGPDFMEPIKGVME